MTVIFDRVAVDHFLFLCAAVAVHCYLLPRSNNTATSTASSATPTSTNNPTSSSSATDFTRPGSFPVLELQLRRSDIIMTVIFDRVAVDHFLFLCAAVAEKENGLLLPDRR
jgi:hypothetical protein